MTRFVEIGEDLFNMDDIVLVESYDCDPYYTIAFRGGKRMRCSKYVADLIAGRGYIVQVLQHKAYALFKQKDGTMAKNRCLLVLCADGRIRGLDCYGKEFIPVEDADNFSGYVLDEDEEK